MNKYERQCLLQAYGWRADTTFDLLHAGENETYVVDTVHMKYALRRYRPGRYTGEQVRSEVAWVDMLHTFMHVPRIVRNKAGDAVSCCHTSTENILYVVSEFVSGETILHPTASHYRTLGHIMRCLHDSADLISTQVSSNWAGWNRPQYDLQYIVEAPLYSLLDFDILTDEDKRRCMIIAAQLTKQFERLETSQQFIHADLHFGNLFATGDEWYCLDFDECGFGHRAIDIGVVRLHLQSLEQEAQSRFWHSFKDGYGAKILEEEAHLGTALRIFYMAGKIPKRLDIEALRHNPEARIRRYLGWVESEICLSGVE